MTQRERDWLVGNPGRAAQAAVLWVGSVGVLILGLQPVLLGALLSEGRVDFDALALAATAEILAIGAGSVIAAFAINARYLRLKAAAFLLIVAAFNVLTSSAPTPGLIIVWRGLAGLFEGGLVAFAVELIARSRYPGRYGGYFVMIQTAAQSILTACLALFIIKETGSAGGFITLALACGLSTIATFWMPTEYGRLPKPEGTKETGLLRLAPILSLASIFTFYMFLGAIWAFLEPLAGEAGINAREAALMVSLSLIAQLVGASAATYLQSRLSHLIALAGVAALGALIAALMATQPSALIFWSLVMATGFIWLFVVPFQIQFTVAADATRSTALLVPAAQLLGAALGPAFGSMFISGTSVTPVAWFACGSAVCSLGICIIYSLRKNTGDLQHA